MTSGDGEATAASELGAWQGPPPAWQATAAPGRAALRRPRLRRLPDRLRRRLAEWLATRLHATGAVEAAFPLLLGQNRGAPDYARLTRLPEPAQVRALTAPVGANWAVFGRLNLTEKLECELFVLNVAGGELVLGEASEHEPERALEAMTALALQNPARDRRAGAGRRRPIAALRARHALG